MDEYVKNCLRDNNLNQEKLSLDVQKLKNDLTDVNKNIISNNNIKSNNVQDNYDIEKDLEADSSSESDSSSFSSIN